MNHLKVKNNDHLYRDVNSGAIINTDRSSFEKYKNELQNSSFEFIDQLLQKTGKIGKYDQKI